MSNSASIRVRHSRAAALEFELSRCRTSQFSWSSMPDQVRMRNDLPYTVFDTGTLDGFKGAVNHWLLPWFVFSFSVAQVLVGFQKKFINNFVFPTWACAAGFNNNNNYYYYDRQRAELQPGSAAATAAHWGSRQDSAANSRQEVTTALLATLAKR